MITFEVTMRFTEPNGLLKEAEMSHTIPYQLQQLANFWSQQIGITRTITVNEDNSERVITYKIPSTENKKQFMSHALDNGVDVHDLFEQYKIGIEKLGGTLSYTMTDDISD